MVEQRTENPCVESSILSPGTMYIVYILKNKQGLLYKGHTNNLDRRLKEHNKPDSSFCRYTRNKGPWTLIYKESFLTRSEAMAREKYFKTGKGREEVGRILSLG